MSVIDNLKHKRKTAAIISVMGVATTLPRIAGMWGEPGSHWPNSIVAIVGAVFAIYYHIKLKGIRNGSNNNELR